jgi:uncharacterized repeat protein (TIGR01451 family)
MTWTAAVEAPADMGLTVTPDSFSIAAGGTQEIVVEADVTVLPSDEWAFAQVALSAGSAPDAHMPVVVRPTTGSLPDLVQINTRRNAGSQLVEGLQALEITELTVDVYGLVPGTLTGESLMEDSANDSPYDDLVDGVFYVTLEAPAGTKRLLAEIIDSTAPDIDLFVGQDANGDGMPQEDEELCSSTTPSWNEYCEFTDPVVGTYWVLVQNWAGSAEQPDDVVLAMAVVPGADGGNMWVEGPTSVPPLEPFDVRVYWDVPTIVAGERWYGAFELGTDAGNPGNIGVVPVNVVRHEDDVTKTVDVTQAMPGDTLTFEIAIQPNVTPQDVTYYIGDTIPAGMTYVEGSATGGATVVDGVLAWSGVLGIPTSDYAMTTSDADPACAAPLATGDAYVDLESYGLTADSGIAGDSVWYFVTTDANFSFYGQDVGNVYNFTDDGFVFFDPSTPGSEPRINTDIPNPDEPNSLLAVFWRDMEIVYDAATNRGVTLASLTSGGLPSASVIEFDDLEPYPAGSTTDRFDFEAVMYFEVDDTPGEYEIIFAFDNLNGTMDIGTIGLENEDGTEGIKYAYDDAMLDTLHNDMAICFDWVAQATDPVVITYQATVDADVPGVLTNNVVHSTDDPGSQEATTSVDVVVEIPEDTMHIERFRLDYRPLGPRYLIMGQIHILDQDHNRVDEARVSLMCEWPNGRELDWEGDTNDQGITWFSYWAPLAGDYECCVTDVAKADWVYAPNQNVQTCESLTIP